MCIRDSIKYAWVSGWILLCSNICMCFITERERVRQRMQEKRILSNEFQDVM